MTRGDSHVMFPTILYDGVKKLLRLSVGAEDRRVPHKAIRLFIKQLAINSEQAVASRSHTQACQCRGTWTNGEIACDADATITVNG
jgi:hypothetical protein